MKPSTAFFTAVTLLCGTAASAPAPAVAQRQAAAVWRCGPEGRSYSDTPCRDGRTLDVAAVPSPAEVRSAQEVAAQQRRLAEQLRQERLLRDATPPVLKAPRQRVVIVTQAVAARAPALRPKPRRHAIEDADTFRAIAPPTRQKQG